MANDVSNSRRRRNPHRGRKYSRTEWVTSAAPPARSTRSLPSETFGHNSAALFPSPVGRGFKVRDLVQRAFFSRAIQCFGSQRALCFSPKLQTSLKAMPSSKSSHETARRLRREQTVAENILWRHLRGRRLCNIKFRRQFPIGPYFIDFCSIERRLIIELDGGQHGIHLPTTKSAQRISLRAALAYFDSGIIRCSRVLTGSCRYRKIPGRSFFRILNRARVAR